MSMELESEQMESTALASARDSQQQQRDISASASAAVAVAINPSVPSQGKVVKKPQLLDSSGLMPPPPLPATLLSGSFSSAAVATPSSASSTTKTRAPRKQAVPISPFTTPAAAILTRTHAPSLASASGGGHLQQIQFQQMQQQQFQQMLRQQQQQQQMFNRPSPRNSSQGNARLHPQQHLYLQQPHQQQQQFRFAMPAVPAKRSFKSSYSARIKSDRQPSNALLSHAINTGRRRGTGGGLVELSSDDSGGDDSMDANDDSVEAGEAVDMPMRTLTHLPPNIFMKFDAPTQELLVPIRLDVEVRPGLFLKDMFTWNITDYTMSPVRYAEILVFDLDLPHSLVQTIAKAIQAQIDFYAPAAAAGSVVFQQNSDLDEDDSIIALQIEVQLGRRLIRDRIMWDTSAGNSVTPEMYASIFAADHGLGGENVPLIAASIREQILLHAQQDIVPSHSQQLHRLGVKGVINKNQLGRTMVIDRLTKAELVELASKHDRQSRRIRRETARMKRRGY